MSPKPVRTRVWAKFTELLDPDDEKSKRGTTPPPSKLQQAEQENWKLRQENDHLRTRLSYYNDAVRSIVMRLKVLDIDKLKEEMGEDGTIPMRMMVRELENLQKAYDDKTRVYGNSYSDSPSPTPSKEI